MDASNDKGLGIFFWIGLAVVYLIVKGLCRRWQLWKDKKLVDSFKRKHVISLTDEPNHQEWNTREWNQYLRKQGLHRRDVNTIISVDHKRELLQDFNPLCDFQFFGSRPKGKVYKSRYPRRIYHFLPHPTLERNTFQVNVSFRMHYVAAIRKLDSKWLPVHFERRY